MPPDQALGNARRPRWRFPLALTLGVWLCTVPLVGIAVAFGLPWEAAVPVLAVLLAAALLVCLLLCNTALRDWHRLLDAHDALRACGRHGDGK